ncbi:MAG: hypothetical protein V1858_00435 [Candidatus Gottesmanbacteria bacterium]
MNQQRKSAVLWLTKQGFQFYISGQKSLLTFSFLPESVKYFDVIDEEKFIIQLELFVKNNNLSFIDTYFIIAPEALLEKEFVKGSDDLINQFIEIAPYELVFSKKLVKEKSVLVSCFNAAFYQLIDSVWQKHDSQIKAVLPYSTVGQTKFDLQTAVLILKKSDSLKNESMVNSQDNEDELLVFHNQLNNKEKSILPIILPVFVILITVLIFVIINANKSKTPPELLNSTPTPTMIIIPTPTNLPMTSISPSALELKNSSPSAFPENNL